jgi:hypothetical protein
MEQWITCSRAEDELETLEVYGMKYTGHYSPTLPSFVPEKDEIKDWAQDLDWEPHHKSHTWPSNCSDAEVGKGRSSSLRYSMGNRTGEYHWDVCDGPQVREMEQPY